MRHFFIVRYSTGAYGLYSASGFLHIAPTLPAILAIADALWIPRHLLAFRYY